MLPRTALVHAFNLRVWVDFPQGRKWLIA